MQIGFIVILIIAIFVAIFAIQNGAPVDVDLFFATFETPLAVVMMTCIIIGAVLVFILGTTRQFKNRNASKEMKSKLKALEGDKILAENKLIEAETEIQTLKGNNSTLTAKISELEEKISNATVKKELDSQDIETVSIESNTIDESTGIEINNEKSETQSE